jgi:hypothetical protein
LARKAHASQRQLSKLEPQGIAINASDNSWPFSASHDVNLSVYIGENRRSDFTTQSLRCPPITDSRQQLYFTQI